MSERILPHEQRRRTARRAVSLLTAAALSGCATGTAKPEQPAPSQRPHTGNFQLNGKGYEKPTILNCETGPRQQQLEFAGTEPKAFVFELRDGSNEVVQALRLKVFGPRSDVFATMWQDPKKETDHIYPVPTQENPAIIPLQPGAVVTVKPVSDNPFKAAITAECK